MKWASDGQVVQFIKASPKVPFVVVCAAGNKARVVNEVLKIDTWADVDELELVPEVCKWR
jgi:hypothetical protein